MERRLVNITYRPEVKQETSGDKEEKGHRDERDRRDNGETN